MKNVIILIGLLISIECFGQTENILNEKLTEQEYIVLNASLDKARYDYDFTNKKVAFFSSPGGTIIQSKADFFSDKNGEINGRKYFDIIVFTEKQKAKHGFDVAIIYESKNTQPKISNKLKRLVKKHNK